ncbi:M61 family metallopeptidase [Rhodanobacter sp. PCA2]|uniref:M61 family metallopeptidase n=1 Tax=Rhodanobacter sp. PCA2 TaxID=2006117 RepID=UPI0015E6F9E3|nr:M61 family metallopeptidase [Rhodanobacter sp. PCA2]MBA2078009.1 hypothetical protein [Rhodanobacter sp. PCA2]
MKFVQGFVLAFVVALLPVHMACAANGQKKTQAVDQAKPSIEYVIHVKDIPGQIVEVDATFPASGADTTLYLPVWTPGYYVKEDYKKNVVRINAYDKSGNELKIADAGGNRWTVATPGIKELVVRYALLAKERSVSRNELTSSYLVLNGSATYITVKGEESLARVVVLDLPKGWKNATGLKRVKHGHSYGYLAENYEELVDSPIMAGDLEILEFTSMGTPHLIAYNRGAVAVDNEKVRSNLKTMVDETRKFWHAKPWRKYAFLLAFRNSGGGLEHAHSTLVNLNPERFSTAAGYDSFLALLAHEYQHSFNVKRLRPLELGPFDYESTPTVSTLWISEGLTSYYSNLMLKRSGLIGTDGYLDMLSKQISALQNSPGRLKQSLAQSSLGVWSNSNSGIGASDQTVSYYIKGEVAGFLLDAHIRKLTDGAVSLDDVMRAAYAKYSGDKGFRPEDFTAVAESVTGHPLKDWFDKVVESPVEVDYSEALGWYGLDLQKAEEKGKQKLTLYVLKNPSQKQSAQRLDWLGRK